MELLGAGSSQRKREPLTSEDKMKKDVIETLLDLGIEYRDAKALVSISRTLHRWDERECGDGRGCIEWDESGNGPKPLWRNAYTGEAHPIRNTYKATIARLKKIMVNYPALTAFHQSDPRGASLYIVPNDRIPENSKLASCYTNGVAVY